MSSSPAELSIVIPTFNESANLRELVERIRAALPSVSWEIVFVDDNSPDGTAQVARQLYDDEPRVRCIRRVGRRGLSSACIEGMLSTSAPFVAVMDADLQHDPKVLAKMLEVLRQDAADLVVGSRYTEGGSVGDWDSGRLKISRFATRLADLVMKVKVTDPMSGFFMMRRRIIEECAGGLSALGFKILLDIIATTPSSTRVKEVPFEFGLRHAGESKLSANVAWEYVLLLGDKLIGRWVPVRFLAFAAIGAIGVFVHFAVLTSLFRGLGVAFSVAQGAAALVAMAFNYTVNNVLTYAGQSLRGWRWWKGLLSFMLVCGVGALGNVGVATYLFGQDTSWALSALVGIVVGAVWNYAVSARYTWKNT